jgi:hypothetical protein
MVVAQRDPVGCLEKTHEKAKAVEAEIVRASDHAGVIGAVLAQELPREVQVGDIAQAIEQTEALEQKLAESAATLADVSAELGREIKKRRQVTDKLNKSQARVEQLSGAKTKKDSP